MLPAKPSAKKVQKTPLILLVFLENGSHLSAILCRFEFSILHKKLVVWSRFLILYQMLFIIFCTKFYHAMCTIKPSFISQCQVTKIEFSLHQILFD